jgi:polysaccharide biosynthesis transport protein
LISSAVLVPLLAILFSSQQSKVYEAKSEVLVSRQNLAATLAGTSDNTVFQDPTRLVETQARIARMPIVANRTVKAVGLNHRTGDDLLNSSSVAAEPNVDLLSFSVRDGDPVLARRLATKYAEQFSLYRSELDTAALSRTLSEVRGRIRALRSVSDTANVLLLRDLLNKEQQLQTLESLQAANRFVVRDADPAVKVQPKPVTDGFIGALIGIALGLALAFLAESLDTRVRSGEEVAERLDLPLLGRIPELPRRLRSRGQLVMLAEPESVPAEAFRMLRTNIDFANLEREAKVIMLTSAVEGEGKSTTAANLAVAYARAGRRVILAELDLRRPNLGPMLGFPRSVGLVDVLVGSATLADTVIRVPVDSPGTNGTRRAATVEFLPAGPASSDVGELFASKRLGGLVEALRERADIVLLDAPPLLLVGDAMALSAQADAIVLVSRLNALRRPTLRELDRVLAATPIEKLGVVLTGEAPPSGYSYAQYYGPKESSSVFARFGAGRKPQAPKRDRRRIGTT